MKAILVIDLPVALEHLLGEEMLLHISHMDCRYIMTETAVLRPLSQKKQHGEEIDYEYGYIDGWNACLEALENSQNGEYSNE